jgi:hypothetical protein
MEETKPVEKQIIGEWENPNFIYQLTTKEFALLTKPINDFEMAVAIKNNILNKARVVGGIQPVYEENVEKDSQGNFQIKKEFIEKHLNPKK